MKQQNLLARQPHTSLTLDLSGADVQLYPDLLANRCDEWFEALREQVAWQQHRLKLFGRTLDAPRLSAWYGDANAHYGYSNIKLQPSAWITPLREIKSAIEAGSGATFNSVLANLYRNGKDSMGWHADDEPELGAQPVIASVSLGATRRMRWRHKRRRFASQSTELASGSVLLMRGHTQGEWQHCVPKVAGHCGERINLTYRFVGQITA